jgi:pimeloyl-ACP methyl ester carboxylesterase
MAYEPAFDGDVALSDGRRVAYCEWGHPRGRPLVLCHGAPGSRVFAPDPETTADAGVRLITLDRPGYGRSEPLTGRQILDWPADVEYLTTALGVHEFDVAGHSSGGPYALACAYSLPQRVRRVALISCMAPYAEPSAAQTDEDAELTALARQDLGRAAAKIAESAAWLADTPDVFRLCVPERGAPL